MKEAEAAEKAEGAAARRDKYRHRINKAKEAYLANAGSVSDLYKTREEFESKYRVSASFGASPFARPCTESGLGSRGRSGVFMSVAFLAV